MAAPARRSRIDIQRDGLRLLPELFAHLNPVRPELKPELPVLNPATFGGHPFPGADRSQGAYHGD